MVQKEKTATIVWTKVIVCVAILVLYFLIIAAVFVSFFFFLSLLYLTVVTLAIMAIHVRMLLLGNRQTTLVSILPCLIAWGLGILNRTVRALPIARGYRNCIMPAHKTAFDYTTLKCISYRTPTTLRSPNGICEPVEYGTSDCPNCHHGNICTIDGFSSYTRKRCTHEKITPCCGDGICDPSELISKCAADCKAQSANLSIDNVQIQMSNLYPFRVTVTNTGYDNLEPQFDIRVADASNNTVCEGSPIISDFTNTQLSPAQSKTGQLTLLGCILPNNGDYELTVTVMSGDYTVLTTTQKPFVMNDPLQNELKQLQNMQSTIQ